MKQIVFVTLILSPLLSLAAPVSKAPLAPAPTTAGVKPAKRISEEDLQGFRKGCMMGADQGLPADATARYCDCFKNRMAETVSRDEYRGYNARTVSSKIKSAPQLPDDIFKSVEKKMTGLVSECSAQLDSETATKTR